MDTRNVYYLTSGTLQPMIVRNSPFFMHHFGLPEYDSYKPVIKQRHRDRANPVCDRLNIGEITEAEAIELLEGAL